METREVIVYKYNELSESSKAKALDWFRDLVARDWSWDFTYEDAERIGEILGVTFRHRQVRCNDGKERPGGPSIWFQGFYTQGSGCAFDGSYRYAKGASKAIRAYAPEDKTLHQIADDLTRLQKPYLYSINAECSAKRDTWLEVDLSGTERELDDATYKGVTQALRNFAGWIYESLQAEYEYQTSDEACIEGIEANEYDFTEDGEVF